MERVLINATSGSHKLPVTLLSFSILASTPKTRVQKGGNDAEMGMQRVGGPSHSTLWKTRLARGAQYFGTRCLSLSDRPFLYIIYNARTYIYTHLGYRFPRIIRAYYTGRRRPGDYVSLDVLSLAADISVRDRGFPGPRRALLRVKRDSTRGKSRARAGISLLVQGLYGFFRRFTRLWSGLRM